PRPDIMAWEAMAPWASAAMVEQDLLRALYQRRRGRDLFDLWDALRRGRVRPARVVEAFHAYLAAEGLRVTRAEFERNLAGKARSRSFVGEGTSAAGGAGPLKRPVRHRPGFPGAFACNPLRQEDLEK
ncbi:MAG: nucleotidyl transferase AbiEii/AbiGii toxin family protein, partial [candidate division NC10 bacterium]